MMQGEKGETGREERRILVWAKSIGQRANPNSNMASCSSTGNQPVGMSSLPGGVTYDAKLGFWALCLLFSQELLPVLLIALLLVFRVSQVAGGLGPPLLHLLHTVPAGEMLINL